MSYQDNVRAAAAALKRGEDANWELARLTYDVCGNRGQGRPTESVVSLMQWATDVASLSGRRFGEWTARLYRDIWVASGIPSQGTDLPPWSEAYADARGGTVGERMVEADFKRAMTNATPEQKRDFFTTAASDPEVLSDPVASSAVFRQITHSNPAAVEQAWQDTDTNIALSEARWKARDDILEPTRRAHEDTREIFEPKDTTLDRTNFFYGIQKRVEQWAFELKSIRDFLEHTDDVNMITRWSTRKALEDLIRAATECRDRLPASYVEAQADDVVTTVTRRERLA